MDIVNKSDIDAWWHCGPTNDHAREDASGCVHRNQSGGLALGRDTDLYFVRFTRGEGDGNELASCTTRSSGRVITLIGSDGQYHAQVSDTS